MTTESKTPRTLPDNKYTISKRVNHNEWHLCSTPSGLVAAVYYQNRAEEIRDALNDVPGLRRENARLRGALKQAEMVLSNQHPVFKPMSETARVAAVLSGIRAALVQS